MANTNVYFPQGGDSMVVASGGTLTLEKGSTLSATTSATGFVQTVRVRPLVSAINASGGAEILPAVAGVKYKIVSFSMISVGGAAGAATSVDIHGWQTTEKSLIVVPIASLVEDTIVTAGTSAGGIANLVCDANKPIFVEKAGSDITTATSIVVVVNYVTEAA